MWKTGSYFAMLASALMMMGTLSVAQEAESRSEKKHPKIGVVLAGGGALGFAHIGVLKVLEENRVPVHCIGGTSMGAIVGGLYASGLSPQEMETFVTSVDWWDILKDATPRKDLHFRRKRNDARYLTDLELGLKGRRLVLPSGFAAGQKFSNVMQTMTVNAVGVHDFDNLNVPYRAVATDIRTGKQVVLDHGNLAVAMRASMAVPCVFTPVELEGRLLVDGMLVNNIPVDVVRDMGADVIIVVDLGGWQDTEPGRQTSGSLSQILGAAYLVMSRPSQKKQVDTADVVVQPDMEGYTPSDFHKGKPILAKGIEAAQQVVDALRKYSVSQEEYEAYLAGQRERQVRLVRISRIDVEGNRRVDERRIRARLRMTSGDVFDSDETEKDLASIYGFGDFETVMYQLDGDGEDYLLRVLCHEKPWGPQYARFGLRLESDMSGNTSWDGLLNWSLLSMNRLGGELELDAKFGTDRGLLLEWYQPLDYRGFAFLAPRIEYRNEVRGEFEGDDRVADYEVETIEAGLDLGLQFGAHAELRLGSLWYGVDASVETGDSALPTVSDSSGGFRCQFVVDRLDDAVFARSGYFLSLNGDVALEGMGGDESFERLAGVGRFYGSRGEHTVTVRVSGSTGFNNDLPEYAEFLLGGAFSLAGLADGQLRGDRVALGSLGYRYRVGKLSPSLGGGVYVIARLDAGNAWEEEEDINMDDAILGAGLGFGADTLVGPVYVGYGLAEGGFSRVYMSVGSLF